MADAPSNAQDLKGRVKEAAGNVSGDDNLKHEGKVDQSAGKLKHGIDQVTEKAKDLLHKD